MRLTAPGTSMFLSAPKYLLCYQGQEDIELEMKLVVHHVGWRLPVSTSNS